MHSGAKYVIYSTKFREKVFKKESTYRNSHLGLRSHNWNDGRDYRNHPKVWLMEQCLIVEFRVIKWLFSYQNRFPKSSFKEVFIGCS